MRLTIKSETIKVFNAKGCYIQPMLIWLEAIKEAGEAHHKAQGYQGAPCQTEAHICLEASYQGGV